MFDCPKHDKATAHSLQTWLRNSLWNSNSLLVTVRSFKGTSQLKEGVTGCVGSVWLPGAILAGPEDAGILKRGIRDCLSSGGLEVLRDWLIVIQQHWAGLSLLSLSLLNLTNLSNKMENVIRPISVAFFSCFSWTSRKEFHYTMRKPRRPSMTWGPICLHCSPQKRFHIISVPLMASKKKLQEQLQKRGLSNDLFSYQYSCSFCLFVFIVCQGISAHRYLNLDHYSWHFTSVAHRNVLWFTWTKWSSGIYPRHAWMVPHIHINQCDTVHQQNEGQKLWDHLNRCSKSI